MTLRDYNLEIKDTADHQYAYNFDFDVMHPFMIRAFTPFFKPGNLLELGSFKGDFTARLAEKFNAITCVEASEEAMTIARERLGKMSRLSIPALRMFNFLSVMTILFSPMCWSILTIPLTS